MAKKKRTQKFYNENEKRTMRKLGLKPAVASGAGWLEKEDGQNDYIICQHKSTDAESYRLQQEDLRKLEYNAMIEKKLPLFVIEFLNNDEIYLLMKPEYLVDIVNYIETPKSSLEVKSESLIDIPDTDVTTKPKRNRIKSGNSNKMIEEMRNEKWRNG